MQLHRDAVLIAEQQAQAIIVSMDVLPVTGATIYGLTAYALFVLLLCFFIPFFSFSDFIIGYYYYFTLFCFCFCV